MNNFMLLFVLLFPFVCSFIGYIIGFKSEKLRNAFNILVTGINFLVVTALYNVVSIEPIDISIKYIMGTGLHLRLDVFRYIFLWITSLIWFLTIIYSTRYLIRYKNRNRYYFFFMLTLASTIGIFISENFLNLFTFFEIMSLTSYALIIHDEDDYAHDAGKTYMVMAVGGGLVLLMGLFLLYNYTQTLDISNLYAKVRYLGPIKYVISGLIITGFGVKAGMMPLHIWLPKAHPAAPAPASAVLSAILLKTGIFGIILTIDIMLKGDFYTSVVIMVIGFMNMFTGGLLALFQRNIKRILAYSSMSQIGYILVGIGLTGILKEYSAIAIYGTLFHIINHAIFKVLLFMGAGIIYIATHELSINKIGGYGINKWKLKIFFAIGLLAIIGMPGFNGFTSKTLLHEALVEASHLYPTKLLTIAEIVFTLSGSFTVAYLLKIFIPVFVESSDNNFDEVRYKPSKATIFPLSVLSFLIILIGVKPNIIMNVLSKALKTFSNTHYLQVDIYNKVAVTNSLITIFWGCVIYVFFVRKFLRKGEGKNWYYVNPAINWFNIETHVYVPIVKVIYYLGSMLFKFIDGFLVGMAYYMGRAFEFMVDREFKSIERMIISFKDLFSKSTKETEVIEIENNSVRNPIDNVQNWINERNKSDETLLSIKTIISSIHGKANSVTYSIFLFVFVLVISLLILIF